MLVPMIGTIAGRGHTHVVMSMIAATLIATSIIAVSMPGMSIVMLLSVTWPEVCTALGMAVVWGMPGPMIMSTAAAAGHDGAAGSDASARGSSSG